MHIKKRSERWEEFSRMKIEDSIKNAGAYHRTAREISEEVIYRDGLKTSDVRMLVAERLTQHNAKLGRYYEAFKKRVAAQK